MIVLLGPIRRAEAQPPSRGGIIAAIVLYSIAAAGIGLFSYGVWQVETAPNARTLGIYHAQENSGTTEETIGAAAWVLGTVTGSVAMLISSTRGTTRRRAGLLVVPTGRGVALAGTF